MNTPQITSCIPTHCRPHLLPRAIRSVFRQTYQDLELWIFDNASEDETQKIVSDFASQDPRVHLHVHEKDIGAIENFAFAMKFVKTPFFSLFSDDDLLLPNFYEEAMALFRQYQQAAAVVGTVLFIDQKGKLVQMSMPEHGKAILYEPPQTLPEVAKRELFWTASLFRTQAVHDVGGYDASLGYAAEMNLWLRIAKKYPMVITSKPFAVFAVHENQISYSTLNYQQLIPNWKKVTSRCLRDADPAVQDELKQAIDKVLGRILFFIGLNDIKKNDIVDFTYSIDELFKIPVWKKRAIMLFIWGKLSQWIPLLSRFLFQINRVRHFFKKRRMKQYRWVETIVSQNNSFDPFEKRNTRKDSKML